MKNKSGQILLITVMLLATVMTIVLSVSFKSATDTQITKLEEESQKALPAAESAIEVALKENQSLTFGPNIANSLSSITGFEGSATIDLTTSTQFTTPSIPKDGSYTFYLGNYDVTTKIIGASTNQNITLCFQSGTPNPAIEVTLVKSSSVKKYVVDPSSRITNASTGSSCAPDTTNYSYSTNIPGGDIGADGQFLLVRVLYTSTKLFFSASFNFPIQGRTISSQATSSTSTGVSKKVVLFQSYPQIPGEFFTTSF
ncbi:MAG: hypothetical protein AAB876_01135 [Patescibacteria group bacterium]